MNFKNYILLISFLSTLLVSCQNQQKEKKIINEYVKKGCFIPSDGVYKFDSLEADTLAKNIFSFFYKYDIDTDKEGEEQIKNWLNDEVFSNDRGEINVPEWYIDDDDLCIKIRFTTQSTKNSDADTLYSRICNSVLQQGNGC